MEVDYWIVHCFNQCFYNWIGHWTKKIIDLRFTDQTDGQTDDVINRCDGYTQAGNVMKPIFSCLGYQL